MGRKSRASAQEKKRDPAQKMDEDGITAESELLPGTFVEGTLYLNAREAGGPGDRMLHCGRILFPFWLASSTHKMLMFQCSTPQTFRSTLFPRL